MLESQDYLRFLLALAFVLALIVVAAWVVRRAGLAGQPVTMRGRQRRLAVVEALPLDAKRRLVLLRRDDAEHLVILGPTAETVVETGIAAPAGSIDGGGPAVDRREA